MVTTKTISIARASDVAEASRCAREIAARAGFGKFDAYYIATAASELATNVFIHGGGGSFDIRLLEGPPGIEVVATDGGPGIADIYLAMQEGYSTVGSLGCGLPGVHRLMDEMAIESVVGKGTQVRACKWR